MEEIEGCPLCGAEVGPDQTECSVCGATIVRGEERVREIIIEKTREKRKVLGKTYDEDIKMLRSALALDSDTAELLCGNGYNSVWKLKRAKIAELTKTGMSRDDARAIKAAAKDAPAKAREVKKKMQEIVEREYECPVCTMVVSGFDEYCYSCGTLFITEVDKRIVPYDITRMREGISTLAFLDDKLLEFPEDPKLWFSRGVLLRSMRKYEIALDSIDRALELNPFLRNAWILKADVLTKMRRFEEAAFCYKKGVEEEVGVTAEEVRERREELRHFLSRLSEERCLNCGATVFVGTELCPLCGQSLLEPEIPEIPDEEAARLVPLENRKEFPRMRPLGLINGQGHINGRGKVNGLINGSGLINGTSLTNLHVLKPRPVISRFSVIGVGVLLILSVILLMQTGPVQVTGIIIDGEFGDWAGVPTHIDPFQSVTNPNINMSRYAVDLTNGQLSWFIEVEAPPFRGTSEPDSFYVFIDHDADPNTGYSLPRIGADYMVQLTGMNDEIMVHQALQFNTSRGLDDWSGWAGLSGVQAAHQGNQIEVGLPTSVLTTLSDDFRSVLYSEDTLGNSTHSSISFGSRDNPQVIINQKGTTDEIIQVGASVPVLTVEFKATEDVHIGEVTLIDSFSNTYEYIAGGGAISAGDVRTDTIALDTTGLGSHAGELISFTVLETRDTDNQPISFEGAGQETRAYIDHPPSTECIDGWFGGWTNQSLRIDVDQTAPKNPNVDINQYFAQHDRDDNIGYFYFNVHGEVLAGSAVPKLKKINPAAPSIPAPPGLRPLRKGEDVARIYVDANSSVPSSCLIDDIFADALVEIHGKYGEIKNYDVYLCQGGSWNLVSNPLSEAANDRSQMEISMSLIYTPDLSNTEILVMLTDWSNSADNATLETSWGTRSRTRAIYTVQGTTSPFSTTAFSHQRKLFHDGTNFWAFYYDGNDGDTRYKYSEDGEDWSNAANDAFTTSGVVASSLWYDSENQVVYIVGDDASSTTTVLVRNGTVSPSLKTITWGQEYSVTMSPLGLVTKAAFICRVADGRLWIVTETQEGGAQYNVAARRSTNPDDISTWDARTILRGSPVSSSWVFPIILPLSNNQNDADAYTLWYADGNIEGKKWENSTGLWGTQESIAITTSGSDYKGPSAVVDSNGVVHAIYSNQTGRISYTYRLSTGAWQSGTPVEGAQSGNEYPTITIMTATDPESLYSFYIRNNQIYCNYTTIGSGSWISLVLTTNTDTKTNLTSIYSASATSYVSWEWLNITGSNFNVNFERIPEFQDMLLPLTSALLIPIIIRWRKR